VKAAQRKQFVRLLQVLERELLGKGPARLDPNRVSQEQAGQDEDEQPLNEMLQAIASSRNRNQEAILVRVQRALNKLEESPDEYGTCEHCEEEIGLGRLRAMPYAELCVDCQANRDGPKGGPTRRKVTDYR
jgi:DnaK suppressor protein